MKKTFLTALCGLTLMLIPFIGSTQSVGGKWVYSAPPEWDDPYVCGEGAGVLCGTWVPDEEID